MDEEYYEEKIKDIKRESLNYIVTGCLFFGVIGTILGFTIGLGTGESKVTSFQIEKVLKAEKENRIQITTATVSYGGIEKTDTIDYKIIDKK